MMRQIDYLERFRKGEIDYEQIPNHYQVFMLGGNPDYAYSALRVRGPFYSKSPRSSLKGVIVETSSGYVARISLRVLRLLEQKRNSPPAYLAYNQAAAYEEKEEGTSIQLEKHSLFTMPVILDEETRSEAYRCGCVAAIQLDIDLVLDHPITQKLLYPKKQSS